MDALVIAGGAVAGLLALVTLAYFMVLGKGMSR